MALSSNPRPFFRIFRNLFELFYGVFFFFFRVAAASTTKERKSCIDLSGLRLASGLHVSFRLSLCPLSVPHHGLSLFGVQSGQAKLSKRKVHAACYFLKAATRRTRARKAAVLEGDTSPVTKFETLAGPPTLEEE